MQSQNQLTGCLNAMDDDPSAFSQPSIALLPPLSPSSQLTSQLTSMSCNCHHYYVSGSVCHHRYATSLISVETMIPVARIKVVDVGDAPRRLCFEGEQSVCAQPYSNICVDKTRRMACLRRAGWLGYLSLMSVRLMAHHIRCVFGRLKLI